MRNNSTNHSGGIIDSTWGWVPGLHTHSEAEAILEQRLLFVPLCWGKDRLCMLTRKRGHTWATIALCSIVLRQGQTSHAHSEAEAILEQRLLFVSLCWGKDRLRMLTRKQRPYLSNDCSLFHCVEARTDFACSLGSRGHTWATIALCFIVWGKDGLHKTMRNNSTNHSGGIIDSTWGHVPGLHAHSEAEAILEQRLLFVPLCWGKDRLRMFTRKQRPYLSNDCSLFHCVRQGWPSQDYEE